jgi:elongation factor Ts
MNITSEQVKELREKTGAGILDCKKALTEMSGDTEKAVEYLRKKGLASAQKKAVRVTKDGLITQYIHAGGKLGVLVEINCETDFVARTEEFRSFARDIAMHVAAANPQFVRREEVPEKTLESEKEIYRSQARESKKPEAILEKIVTGKLESFFKDACLLEQPFVKNPDKTVQEITTDLVSKIGENITIKRFVRFQLGETASN